MGFRYSMTGHSDAPIATGIDHPHHRQSVAICYHLCPSAKRLQNQNITAKYEQID